MWSFHHRAVVHAACARALVRLAHVAAEFPGLDDVSASLGDVVERPAVADDRCVGADRGVLVARVHGVFSLGECALDGQVDAIAARAAGGARAAAALPTGLVAAADRERDESSTKTAENDSNLHDRILTKQKRSLLKNALCG